MERIQHELGTVAHPEFWYAGDWLELRTSRSRWYVCCTPQITKRNIQVGVSTTHVYWVYIIGQLKIEIDIYDVISYNNLRYSTCSNNKYYIINNYHQVHTWGLKPQYHTHLGIMFFRLSILTSFKINYLYFCCVGTWHSAPSYSLILLCRYVTLWSPKSTCRFVTPDPLNLRVGSWHSIP